MPHIIYGLYDPTDGLHTIRYVGYTSKEVERRVTEHLAEATQQTCHRHNWLMSLRRRGIRPAHIVLEDVNADNWQERERDWIAHFRSTLTNSTDGGEGLINPSVETRINIGKKVSLSLVGNQRRKGIPHSPEIRAKIASRLVGRPAHNKGQAGHKQSEETRRKISLSKLGKPHPRTPEWTENLRQANIGRKHSPETVAKRALSQIGNQRALGCKRTDEHKHILSEVRRNNRWITDGLSIKQIRFDAPLPDGWQYGMRKKNV